MMRVFFGPPIRMQYDFTINRFDSHSDFIITYKYDFKNGYRDFNLKCNELEEKILIIGDSFGFGQGVKVENSLKALNKGIQKIHIISGEIKNALINELETEEGIGTVFQKNELEY